MNNEKPDIESLIRLADSIKEGIAHLKSINDEKVSTAIKECQTIEYFENILETIESQIKSL